MKKIVILLLLLAMTLTLFACRDKTGEETETESIGISTEEKTEDKTEGKTEGKSETEKPEDTDKQSESRVETVDTESGETADDDTTADESTATETDSSSITESNTESNTESGSETESQSEGNTETESNTENESDSSTVTESDTESDVNTETMSGTETESDIKEQVTEKPTEKETEKQTEKETEKETEEMETVVLNDGLASVGKYNEYDLDVYMSPVWDGKVVHNETVMFVGIDDVAPLLYTPDRIISVRSYDLQTEYVQGVDYDLVDGRLVLLEGTRIPYVPLDTYYSVLDPNYPYLSTMYNGKVTQTMFGDGDTMTKWQVAVTYKHSDTWEGKIVESYEDRYADFIGKLERGEDVTVFFYGDSITTGATSSQSRAPYAPSFSRMFVQYVAKQYGYTVKYVNSYTDPDLAAARPSGGQGHADSVYGTNGTITYINNAVGGWSTQNGRDNYPAYVGKYIREYGCDLFVLAFGMNNGGSKASDVANYLTAILRSLYKSAPETDVVLVSTMIPNPEAVRNPADKYYCNGNQYTFEAEMYPLAESINKDKMSCAIAPMTSVSQYIHSQKRYRDTTGNNVNHPSDFLARVYAQVIYQTVFGYENYEEEPTNIGEVPALNVNYNAEITQGGSTLYLDGQSGTANQNFASCVRIEATNGGFFMYHVKDGVKEYVNVGANGIEYAESGTTVWKYNATLKAMVSSAGDVAVKLVTPEICLHPTVKGDGVHYVEKCIRCGVEYESAAHTMSEKVITSELGSETHRIYCAKCGSDLAQFVVPAGINHYYPVANMGIYNGENGGILIEDGFIYRRINFNGGEGHVFVNAVNNTTDINGNTGKYLVIKFRTAANATFKLDLCTSDNEGSRTSISRSAASLSKDGWEIAVVELSQFAKYTTDSDLKAQVRITTGVSYVDIAYAAIVDSEREAGMLIGEGTYLLYSDWSSDGVLCEVQDEPAETTPEETTPEETTPEETAPEEETTPKERDDIASVGIYSEYDLDSYMTPIWDGSVVHNETVLFVGPNDTPALLYNPDRIISVRSYDLSTEYYEGIDFEIVDGKIVRLEGSSMPYIPLETYYSSGTKKYLSTMYNGVVTPTLYGEGNTICKWQIAITYKHSDTWEGPDLNAYTDRYAELIEKLEKGEDVTFHFYGDSITAGGNASSSVGMSPYMPIWAKMFTHYVAKQYGYTVKYADNGTSTVFGNRGTITYVNTAVGGWSTGQGNDNFDEKVKAYTEQYGCDLFILAFGMNNGSSTADTVCNLLDQIVTKLEACAPDADVLLVSTMLPNPDAVRNPDDAAYFNGNQSTFEEKMIPLAEAINNRGTDCALAPMTSMTRYLYTIKKFRDTTGNNVNHPSDFVVRLYAQTLFQTVFGYENYESGTVKMENKPQENVSFNAELTLGDNTLYLDGASGTTNKNYAACVRFEETEGGYYTYYVKDGAKVYINVDNGAVVYSDTAISVWTYDDSLEAVVSGGLALKLSAPEICLHPTLSEEESHRREACLRCGIESEMRTHVMNATVTENEDGSTTYSLECQVCGKAGRTYTVPAGVIYYSGEVTSKSPIFYLLNKEVRNEGDISFTRITPKTSDHGHELHWIDQNSADHFDYAGKNLDTKGARYVVIKVRVCSDDIKLRFHYRLWADGTSTPEIHLPVTTEGEWITYVIDLESVTPDKYQALGDGSYLMRIFKLYVGAGFDQIENAYIDVAYMAVCDGFEEIEKIVDTKAVQLVTASGSATEVAPDGSCLGTHLVNENVNGNTYTYSCTVCGKVIGEKVIDEEINKYLDRNYLSVMPSGGEYKVKTTAMMYENGVAFTRFTGKGETGQTIWTRLGKQGDKPFADYQIVPVNVGEAQYLVIKMRASDEIAKLEFALGTIVGEATIDNIANQTKANIVIPMRTIVGEDWTTLVLDLSAWSNMWKADTSGDYIVTYLQFTYESTESAPFGSDVHFDFSYMAFVDDWDEVKSIVDQDTVELMTSSGSSLTVKAEDGSCMGTHNIVDNVSGTTHTLACSICGHTLGIKEVPEGINLFRSAGALLSNANGASLINYAEIMTDEDELYTRVYGGASHSTQNYNQFMVFTDTSASTVTGRYLVLKYRVGENGLGQNEFTIFAGTENNGPTSENEHITLKHASGVVEDGQWHVAIIDMSTMTSGGFLEKNGEYRAKYVAIRPFWPNYGNRCDENDYTDIAFAAVCDSIEKAESLIEGSSYAYYTTSSTPTIVNITE